jgi:hypothetical protein
LSRDGAAFEFEWGDPFLCEKTACFVEKMPMVSLKDNGSFFKRKAFFED